MTALAFVDASVLVLAADDHDPAQRDRARAWLALCWQRRSGRLSTQVLNSYYNAIRRLFPSPVAAGDARAEIRRLQTWQPWQIDHHTMEAAWAVEARHRLPYNDALLVAAAQQQGCTLLLSAELPHDLRIDALRIVSPILAHPSLLDETP